ncbi:hypothetical protein [Marinoscillum furvescens]|uniref:Uncharacterized protein n=1 Tax=Marinoscillum furvescens DSM 4134 TaxID=1122208 RepID=A0A3D9L022_MARFU|nr:hypothetical protein [Marinoscillum furvescens]RED93883.1 hypothetical protein C7460_12363 [Marinoscillum furvescens DSM 4134]
MNVKISYQTLQLPPPHAFAYTLDLSFVNDEVQIAYELEFLNRDDISREEIEAEGFSENDDYKWEGTLGNEWASLLHESLQNIELEDESEDFNIYLHVEMSENGETRDGMVVLAEEWDYKLQELIQAIYEKAGIEKPLKMLIQAIAGNQRAFYEVSGSFEKRAARINKTEISWEALHDLMADIYTIDFDQEPVKSPTKDGLWVDPDGESGYQRFEDQAGPKAEDIKKRILQALEV